MITRKPQEIDDSCWYYENGASIDLILSVRRVAFVKTSAWKQGARTSSVDDGFIHIRIPSRKLVATLKRQGKVR